MSIREATAAFHLEKISYRYLGRHSALIDVDLTVRQGDRLAILGANGCGKSTLLKLMDGLFRPTGGRIQAFGDDISEIANDSARSLDFHRRVGLVFQDADAQLFSPTVWDDVAFGPLQMGWPLEEVRRRSREALAMMGVEHLADRAPYELSGGEKKRVSIATVLSIDPEVLLLDEPTANLDPRSKAVLIDLIDELGRRGKTMITTTQELEIVPLIATRVVVFGDAERRPIFEGVPDEVLANKELLLRANLIHEHTHLHNREWHSHQHSHEGDHEHPHE